MSKIPVLIPAHNEAILLGNTLAALPSGSTEPIVLANACKDATADVARGFGVQVIELEEQGKMPATQEGFRSLGRKALGPVLMLDADSVPVFPYQWLATMTSALEGVSARAVASPVVFAGENRIASPYRSAKLYAKHLKNRAGMGPRLPHGICIGTNLQTSDLLDEMLSLDHYWPGEDRAIVDTVIALGGSFTQCINPLAAVRASDRYHLGLSQRFQMHRTEANCVVKKTYADRAAPGSRPYNAPRV